MHTIFRKILYFRIYVEKTEGGLSYENQKFTLA